MKKLAKFLSTPIGLILAVVPAIVWTYLTMGNLVGNLFVFVVVVGIGIADFIAGKVKLTLSEAIVLVMRKSYGRFLVWALVLVPYLLIILYLHFWGAV